MPLVLQICSFARRLAVAVGVAALAVVRGRRAPLLTVFAVFAGAVGVLGTLVREGVALAAVFRFAVDGLLFGRICCFARRLVWVLISRLLLLRTVIGLI